jgi:hypothetical protein
MIPQCFRAAGAFPVVACVLYAAPSMERVTAVFATASSYRRQFAEPGDPNEPGTPVSWPLFSQQPAAPFDAVPDRFLALGRSVQEGTYHRDQQRNSGTRSRSFP